MFFERPRVRWWAVVGAAAVTLAALLLAYQYKMDVRIYADAPGFSILQAANRAYEWTPERARSSSSRPARALGRLIMFVPRFLTRGVRPVLAVVGAARAHVDARGADVGREHLEHVLRGALDRHRPPVRLDRPRDRRRADALPRATAHRLQRPLADGVLEPLAQARLVDRRQRAGAGAHA